MNSLEILLIQQMYAERLKSAERSNLHKIVPKPTYGGKNRLRNLLGNWLIGSGQKVKGMGPVTWAGA